MGLRLISACATLLLGGCYNSTTPPIITTELPVANCLVSELRESVNEGGYRVINESSVIVGRVTSSDRDDNFYRTMIVQDQSGGIEVVVGLDRLHTTYPEGLLVALSLKGCTLGYRYGTLQVGSTAPSYESYDIDYLHSQIDAHRVIVRSSDIEIIEPTPRTIAELRRDMCGEYAEISNLRLVASTSIDTLRNESLANARWRGYALFCDEHDDTLLVFTRDYATYANNAIPHSVSALRGIVQHGKHRNGREYYQLKMRYGEDCTAY